MPVFSFENIMGLDELQEMQAALELFKEYKDRPVLRTAKIACRNHPLAAPRSDKDADGGVSVEKAIDTWCKDNDGANVGFDGFHWRWGITHASVPDRSSFWLRVARTCPSADKFNREECKKALMDGMQQCDKGATTYGLAALVDCLDYSIDLSGITDGNIPPPPGRKRKKIANSRPREFAEKKNGNGQAHAPICDKNAYTRPLSDADLNSGIDAFCQNGQKIKGFGKLWANMFDYPPSNKPQFYPNDGHRMHLTFGAETMDNGGEEPYQDMRWRK